MPHPFPLATAFSAGMRRDVDRTELPGGSAYNMVDFIPDEIQAVTGGRGGWTLDGSALPGSPSSISIVGYHPDLPEVMGTDGTTLWKIGSSTSVGTFTGSSAGIAPPAYHRGYLIFGSGTATGSAHTPYALSSSGTLAALTATPFIGAFPTVYKDHAVMGGNPLILTGGLSLSNRIYFSAAGDPTTWDTTFGWWDTTDAITGLATVPNAILVFHANSTERLRGTTPPPGSDFVLDMFMPKTGCIDAFSIASWQNNVIWCASNGIYMTDGVKVVDLTNSAQMKTYWQSLMTGYSSSWRIAGGIYQDHYIVSINNGTTLVDCLCINLASQSMWRFSNIHANSFVQVKYRTREELHMGLTNQGRVAALSSLWSPSATVKQDGDGTNPTPIVETAMFRGFDRLHRRWIESMGKQKWRWAYVDYDLRDAATDNPTATLSYCTTPTGSYTQAGTTLAETTDFRRVRRALSPTQGGATHSQQLGLKFAVSGPYASAKLYALEGDFSPIEIGSL